jgi:hypothetical protein
MINKRFNNDYDGDFPKFLGDRMFAQDVLRDMSFMQDRMARIMQSIDGRALPIVIRGRKVFLGAGPTVSIPASAGLIEHTLDIVDSFASDPFTKAPLEMAALVDMPEHLDQPITGGNVDDQHHLNANTDGATTNYIKVRYVELVVQSRNRTSKAGSYECEVNPTWRLVIDDVAPTDEEIILADFVTDGVTITLSTASRSTEFRPEIQNDIGSPIGSIQSWLGGYFADALNGGFNNVLGDSIATVNGYISDYWRVCDGSELLLDDSPIFNVAGRFLPNLSDDRFVMGSTGGGVAGGENSQTHSVPSHKHFGTTENYTAGNDLEGHVHSESNIVSQGLLVAAGGDYGISTLPVAPNTGVSASVDHVHEITVGDLGGVDGNSTMVTGVSENRPKFLSVFYIMRVK